MSWLKELTQRMLENMPKDAFTDWTFGFGDIERAVDLVEKFGSPARLVGVQRSG